MWYQQYLNGDTHGWHIHGQHFTGVYYLEFPDGCSKTEVCSPFNLKSKCFSIFGYRFGKTGLQLMNKKGQ